MWILDRRLSGVDRDPQVCSDARVWFLFFERDRRPALTFDVRGSRRVGPRPAARARHPESKSSDRLSIPDTAVTASED
ncbi:MAG: hypothetical protein D8M59_16485 [Planctomycetes bacterium]|nr:hypothetical protein [Planctomycetota bacterium]NOG53376.1 hypothetical protein [Planctomycetota bacterium]